MHDFTHLEPMLAKYARVIRVDLPGFGASDHHIPDYSIRAHARYVVALMDRLDVDRADVLGFSMGSGVALEMFDLAPQRVNSLVLLSGIGIQEGEGSGDYYYEHIKYAFGYAGLVILPELIPHFGLFGPRAERHAFIRNFWDSDQRPLRGILQRINVPTLIIHGRRDPLVPAWVAREHHDLVPDSELVMLDDSHFMVFSESGSRKLADKIIPFLTRIHHPGFRPQRRTDDPFAHVPQPPSAAASRPNFTRADSPPVAPDGLTPESGPLPVNLQLDRAIGPWWQTAALIAATFVSEDLTCIAAALLIRRLQLDWFVGLTGCFVGIFLGDLGLWLLGRFVGRGVIRWTWVRRRLPVERMERVGDWFDRRGWLAVLTARFLPGTRFPVYVAAGMLGRRAGRFMLWALVAAMLWTPLLMLLVVLFGDSVVQPLERLLGGSWLALPAAAAVLFVMVRVAALSLTELGRARLIARVSKLWRWEFWPTWLFYLPLVPYIAWLALRHRGLTVPTAANPAIPHGGIVGESKFDILMRLPQKWIIPSALLPPSPRNDVTERTALLDRVMRERGWCFPLILKPDAAQRGAGVKLIRDPAAAAAYLDRHPQAVLVQTYHPGPCEAGIFYYRMPAECPGVAKRMGGPSVSPASVGGTGHPPVTVGGTGVPPVPTPDGMDAPSAPALQRAGGTPAPPEQPAPHSGRIFSITDKHFPVLTGDGHSTVEMLIWRHPRYRMQAATFLRRLAGRIDHVPAVGETLKLAVAGNHCQGTLFRDGSQLITPQLEAAIDSIARQYDGFHFGRFDVRYADPNELRAGRGFAIVELNGATSESTNIYDPSRSILWAWRTLLRQWSLLFQIGAANRAAGVPATPLRTLLHEVRNYYRGRSVDPLAD